MTDPETSAWRPDREHVLWLAGALAVVVAPHLPRLPLWLSGSFVLALLWRYAQVTGRLRPTGAWMRTALMAAVLGGVFAHHGTVLGREAGVALLVGLSGLKLLETRTLRDAYVVTLLCFFLVVTGFLFSQSIPIGAYMLAAVLVLTATLVTLTLPRGTLAASM